MEVGERSQSIKGIVDRALDQLPRKVDIGWMWQPL